MTDEALILRRMIDERREKELAEERVVIEALQARMSAVRGETAPAVSESEMLNIAEAVQFLGVSKTYFYRLKNEGAFKVMRIGKTNRIFRSDLIVSLLRERRYEEVSFLREKPFFAFIDGRGVDGCVRFLNIYFFTEFAAFDDPANTAEFIRLLSEKYRVVNLSAYRGAE